MLVKLREQRSNCPMAGVDILNQFEKAFQKDSRDDALLTVNETRKGRRASLFIDFLLGNRSASFYSLALDKHAVFMCTRTSMNLKLTFYCKLKYQGRQSLGTNVISSKAKAHHCWRSCSSEDRHPYRS